jgi:hypothetical protein
MANPYTRLPGYKCFADYQINGHFCVFDRTDLGDKWYLEQPRHQWLVKKMPDGPTMTTRAYGEAKIKANVSSRTVRSHEIWWE